MHAISMELSPAPRGPGSPSPAWGRKHWFAPDPVPGKFLQEQIYPVPLLTLRWDAFAQTQTRQWYLFLPRHLAPASHSFLGLVPKILQQPLTPSIQELQEKNLQKLHCEHKMALKSHGARDQIKGGTAFNQRSSWGYCSAEQSHFPRKKPSKPGLQGLILSCVHRDPLSQSVTLSAPSQRNSDKRKMQLHLNLLGKFIMDNLNTLQNLVCRMHPLIGLHSAVIN